MGEGGGAGVEDVVHTWDGKESDKKEWREIMMRKNKEGINEPRKE